MIKEVVGENIRSLRLKTGESQAAFARRLGIHNQILNRWESGKVLPTCENLERLAEIYGVSSLWFFHQHEAEEVTVSKSIWDDVVQTMKAVRTLIPGFHIPSGLAGSGGSFTDC